MGPKLSENPIKILTFYLKNFKNELKQLNYSENTILAYEREINYFIEFFREFQDEMDLNDINRPFIQQSLIFRENFSRNGKISTNTKKMYLKAIYQFFVYLVDSIPELRDITIFFSKIKIQSEKKEKDYFAEKEIKTILSYIENTLSAKSNSYLAQRNALMVKLLIYTGLRANELVNLKFSDFRTFDEDLDVWQIKILGKGKKEAYCYIDKEKIAEELENLKIIRTKLNIISPYIFVSKKGRQLTRAEAYQIVSRLLKKIGFEKKGLHIFRHSLGFLLAQKGVRIEDIQEILRHSNINTTRIYVQRTELDKINGIKKIDLEN